MGTPHPRRCHCPSHPRPARSSCCRPRCRRRRVIDSVWRPPPPPSARVRPLSPPPRRRHRSPCRWRRRARSPQPPWRSPPSPAKPQRRGTRPLRHPSHNAAALSRHRHRPRGQPPTRLTRSPLTVQPPSAPSARASASAPARRLWRAAEALTPRGQSRAAACRTRAMWGAAPPLPPPPPIRWDRASATPPPALPPMALRRRGECPLPIMARGGLHCHRRATADHPAILTAASATFAARAGGRAARRRLRRPVVVVPAAPGSCRRRGAPKSRLLPGG